MRCTNKKVNSKRKSICVSQDEKCNALQQWDGEEYVSKLAAEGRHQLNFSATHQLGRKT